MSTWRGAPGRLWDHRSGPVMTHLWPGPDSARPPETCTIAGFGVKVVFSVGEKDWRCEAAIPSWLPIPQSAIEDKFDNEFADLKGL